MSCQRKTTAFVFLKKMQSANAFLEQAQRQICDVRADVRCMIDDYRRQRAVQRSFELVDATKQQLLLQAKAIVQCRSDMLNKVLASTRNSNSSDELLSYLCAALADDYQRCLLQLYCHRDDDSTTAPLLCRACVFQPVLHVLCGSRSMSRFETSLTRDLFLLSDDDFAEKLFGGKLLDQEIVLTSDAGFAASVCRASDPTLGDQRSVKVLADDLEAIASGSDRRTEFLASLLASKRALSIISKDAKFVPQSPDEARSGDCVRWPLLCRMENLFYCVASVVGAVMEKELDQLLLSSTAPGSPSSRVASSSTLMREWDDLWMYCWKFIVVEKIRAVHDVPQRRRRASIALTWFSQPELGLSEEVLTEARSSVPGQGS